MARRVFPAHRAIFLFREWFVGLNQSHLWRGFIKNAMVCYSTDNDILMGALNGGFSIRRTEVSVPDNNP